MSLNNNNNNNTENNDIGDNNSKLGIIRKQFQEKEQQRLQSKLEKREVSNKEQIDQSSSNIASESLNLINNLSNEIENLLNQIVINDNNKDGSNTVDYLKPIYDKTEDNLSEITSITTMSSHMLTQFDVKSTLENIENLKKLIDKSKEKYMPKQKLSLTRKKSTKPSSTPSSTPSTTPPTAASTITPTASSPIIETKKEPTFNLCNISGFNNKELIYPPSKEQEINSSGTSSNNNNNNNENINDLFISDLIDCKIYLNMKVLTALKINNLKNCTIIAYAPIDGSIFIDNCNDCLFSLVTRQIRIHQSLNCQFNIFVKSNPIIEACKKIKFSKYSTTSSSSSSTNTTITTTLKFDNERFKEFSFDLESQNIDTDKWKLVNDFDWIQQKQSPNWSIVD